MTDVTETDAPAPASWWATWRAVILIVGAFLLVAGAWALIGQAIEQGEIDQRSDEYYCTLSGVGPYDRGPETGELCVDLLGD